MQEERHGRPPGTLHDPVHGVDVFEMRSQVDRHFRDGSFVLDVSRGLPSGFSLTPGDGLRFTIRDSRVGDAAQR